MESLSRWIRTIGLERPERLERLFADNDIAADVLPSLTEGDLEKLGVSMGERKRLMQAIAALDPALSALDPMSRPASPSRPDELRQLTIMFCDLVDSTSLCERLSPEQWREVVVAYQQAAAEVIERYGGLIAQYLGDGLMVYFGHPQAYEDAAERAVRAGLALVQAIPALTIRPGPHGAIRLSLRIGVHTGQVVIGEIGVGPRREQMALGEAPNVAARLQGLAAPDTVLISDSTRKLAGGGFHYQDLGRQALKGVSETRQVWQVTQVSEAASRFEAATSAGLTPLVGRTREIEALVARWQAALAGHGQVVLLSGEAGIGKSRLLKEVGDRLGNQGLRAIRLQCSPHHLHRAFHPSIDCLERRLRLTPGQPAAEKLERLEAFAVWLYALPKKQVALLASMLSIPFEEHYGPLMESALRHEQDTIAALVDLLAARARMEPTLMLVEDVHWADPATVAMLTHLIARARDLPLLVVITHRPEFQLRRDDSLDDLAHVTTLKVAPLHRSEVAALVSQITADRLLPAGLSRHIVNKTDGVPLFVEELTKSILERPIDRLSPAGERAVVPSTLQDSLMSRLDRFAAAKEIAQIGSVLGREFSHDLIEALCDMPKPVLAEALAALTQSGLAAQMATHHGRAYTFKHALVQDAAYDSLPQARREALHGAVVRVVESRFPAILDAQPEMLARHASAARLPGVAIPYWRRASELALQRLALREASAHLQAGLGMTALLPPSGERDQTELQLQASLGTVHMLGKGWAAPEVEQAYARANELAEATDKVEESIWPMWGVCVFHLVRGRIDLARDIGDRMTTLARQANSRIAWLVANMIHTQLCLYNGRLSEVQLHGEQVEHRYRDPQDRALIALYSTDLLLVARVHVSQTRWIMGEVDDAVERCDAQERFAASLGHPYSLAWVLTWGAMSYLHRGDVEGLLSRVEQGLRLADQHGFAYVAAIGTIAQGWGWTRQGALADGIARMQQGLEAFKATGAGIAVPFFQALLAEALGEAGRHAEGLALLADSWRRMQQGGERWHEAELHRIRARLLATGPHADLPKARASLAQALAVATQQRALSWQVRAEADLARLPSPLPTDQRRPPKSFACSPD